MDTLQNQLKMNLWRERRDRTCQADWMKKAMVKEIEKKSQRGWLVCERNAHMIVW